MSVLAAALQHDTTIDKSIFPIIIDYLSNIWPHIRYILEIYYYEYVFAVVSPLPPQGSEGDIEAEVGPEFCAPNLVTT